MPWRELPDTSFTLFRHLSGGEFALAFVNMSEAETLMHCELVDLGIPVSSGFALELRDAFTGESLGAKTDYFNGTRPWLIRFAAPDAAPSWIRTISRSPGRW